MVVGGRECVLCSLPSMTDSRNGLENLKYQVRSIFVLQKLLQISSRTCEELLKEGNPSSWFSFCIPCFETIIEAERIFTELVKLENKWKNLKGIVNKTIYECFNQNNQKNTNAASKAKLIDRIRNEAINTFERPIQFLHNVGVGSQSHLPIPNTEEMIKPEIEFDFYEENASPLFQEIESGDDTTGNTLFAKDNEESENKGDTVENKCHSRKVETHTKTSSSSLSQDTGLGTCSSNYEVGRRTRSGRLVKSKYSLGSDDNVNEDRELSDNDWEEPKDEDDDESESELQCNFCPVVSKSVVQRMDHENRCHGQKHKQACKDCGRIYDSGYTLKQHRFFAHNGIRRTRIRKGRLISASKNINTQQATDDERKVMDSTGSTSITNELDKSKLGLQCPKCNRVFMNYKGLNVHQKRYECSDVEKSYKCEECGKGTLSAKSLSRHMKQQHKLLSQKQFSCDQCKKRFATCGLLEIHAHSAHRKETNTDLSKSSNSLTFPCSKCDRSFHTFYGRKRHEIRTHVSGKEKPYPCSQCDRGFVTYRWYSDHAFQAHGIPRVSLISYRRLICSSGKRAEAKKLRIVPGQEENAVERKSKKTHVKHPCTPLMKPFPCKDCNLSFATEPALEGHIQRQHDKDFTVGCSECSKRFLNSKLMKHHFKIVHSKEKDFVCEICSASFSANLQLKYHRMRVHEKNPVLQCKECGHYAADPTCLKKHIANIHNKSLCAHKCPVCDFRTISKSALDHHVLRRHTNEKAFSCTKCEKSYSSTYNLKVHMRTHTGERPYKCRFCEKDFHELTKMKRHEQDLHSTKNDYQCHTCGKTFPSPHYLSTHVYDVHKKRQRDPVEEKVLMNNDLLKEVLNEHSTRSIKPNASIRHLQKTLQGAGEL